MKTVLVPSAIALFLAACTNQENVVSSAVKEALTSEAHATSEFYINKANQAVLLEEQHIYLLLAVRKLIEENKAVEARNTFADIVLPLQDPNQQLEYNLVASQLAVLEGKNSYAKYLLSQIQQPQLTPSQQLRYLQTRAKLAENEKDVIEAVRLRSQMDVFLTNPKARQENNDKIWEILRGLNRGLLDNANAHNSEIGLSGWLALITAYNTNIANPVQMPEAIAQWKQLYPSHTAALLPPTELQNVGNFQQTQLNSVALLLPLSGDQQILGQIIKMGFDDAKGNDTTPVHTFDTNADSVVSLVDQARTRGVQTVIGPLLKPRVDELLSSQQFSGLNVLALNSTPNAKAINKVCYYGLSPEAEARSGADKIYKDGLGRAVVLAPNSDFGQRSADAFAQRWQQISGSDADVRYYNQSADGLVLLQNAGLTSQTGLYILGSAEELMEIKQSIDNSELAGAAPIYTSSRSNSPNNGADFRLAMEGVKFSEIPLLSDTQSENYKRANKLAESDFSMMRLYAMGSDAWVLANRFNEFRQIPGYSVSGLTGNLTAGTNCNIERNMTWLKYSNGTIITTY